MRALDRKVIRDLWQMKGQALAIALVIAAGIAVFLSMLSALDSLKASRQSYYTRYRFADVFARVVRAPAAVAERIAEIPGVGEVETRVVTDVSLDVPGMLEPASARLVSIPEGARPRLNDLHLRSGRLVEPASAGEVVVSEAFALAHGLVPGNSLSAVINGRRQRLQIVGIALSPEYIYSLRGGDLFPDDRLFGVMWMGRDALSAALDMRGAFNDLTLTLSAGASEPDVIAAIDAVLAPYGAIGAHGRSKQISDWFVSSELDQLRGSAIAVPAIFLAVAAFLLNIVIARVVGAQRTQIATLKAFGYSGLSIGVHYLKMALSIVLVGTVLGTAAGLWLAAAMTQLYARYFRFPVLDLVVSADTCVLSVLVAVGSATAGVVTAVKRAMALPPAQAMLPEAPPVFRRTVVERLGLHRLLPSAWRMVLRNIERRPVRAFLSGMGMAFAAAILVVGMCMQDAIALLMDQEFRAAQRQDALVLFTRPTPSRAMQDLLHMPGVLSAEPFRSVGVTLRSGHLNYSTSIFGMPRRPELHRVIDRNGGVPELPRDGLVLTTGLGRMLGVDRGDEVTVELMEDRRQTRQLVVAGLVDTFLGVSAYMDIDALRRVLHEGDTLSGAALKVDARSAAELFLRLKRTPGVMGVGSKQAALEGFEKTIAENQGVSTVFEIGFAVLIAFAVVYNAARIALAERSRELASLRVLGFTRAEVSAILLGELGTITVAFVPGGLLLGYGLAALLVEVTATELYRIPLVVSPSTYAVAAVVILASAVVSALVVRRRLDRLDLVAVLKTRD